MSQHAIVQALRQAHKAPALPQAPAAAEAAVVIERASFCAPEFVDVEPALDALMAFGRDSLPPPPPEPAGPVAESDAGIPASPETQPTEPVPAPKRTGLHGREILTLKKSRKVSKLTQPNCITRNRSEPSAKSNNSQARSMRPIRTYAKLA